MFVGIGVGIGLNQASPPVLVGLAISGQQPYLVDENDVVIPNATEVPVGTTVRCVADGIIWLGADAGFEHYYPPGEEVIVSYVWKRNNVAIPGATTDIYVLAVGDIGSQVECYVRGMTSYATSDETFSSYITVTAV